MTITQDIQDRLAVRAALSPSKLNTWLNFGTPLTAVDAMKGTDYLEGLPAFP